jgi:hypothetical protein
MGLQRINFEDSKTNAPKFLSKILSHTKYKDKVTPDRIATQATN